eukprot:CAMPEP_0196791246 /NCGR_PEP_ID=MMETSP1104-20130614/29569_1 /TAXON_ID=33652 /ORGANISM="Cafeteria sp., Strain Caron Lab Isolate" /LENGTH=34 /DNA_ID= /DNA_START= /DNA_END= /DNA_ORIENTATION=
MTASTTGCPACDTRRVAYGTTGVPGAAATSALAE